MKKTAIGMAIATMMASPAFAASFVNGGFDGPNAGDAGTTNGWVVAGSTYRNSVNNTALTPAFVIANAISGGVHSAVIDTNYVDPRVGAALGTTVYGGSYAYRVEDTTTGGYASLIQQTVANYTDADIFFAWKAVLLGAHGINDAATMRITLNDDTDGVNLIDRTYNAASGGGGVDARFSLLNNNYYTADWQIEQLNISAALSGHTFTLSVLASDCQPTGHWGYVYLDGFGAQIPDPGNGVPEPASLALVGLGLAGLAASRRRQNV
jgi:hypothetical protein